MRMKIMIILKILELMKKNMSYSDNLNKETDHNNNKNDYEKYDQK